MARTLKLRSGQDKMQFGVVPLDEMKNDKFRKPELELYDSYYEGRQYDKLVDWLQAAKSTTYVPIRDRKPLVNYNLSKVLCDRVASKLLGHSTFPTFTVENDPDTTAFVKIIVKTAKLQHKLMEPIKRMLNSGSVLVRYYVTSTSIQVEHYLAKYCYPEFLDNNELKSVRIQYVYSDEADKDENGKPREKWYRIDLGPETDTLYDNPLYAGGDNPTFQVVSEINHNLGFVQAEWLRTTDEKFKTDGYALVEDITGFVDEINYSLSQSGQAVSYNQDPQLTFQGIDEEELNQLTRSSQKGWNLGREGEATFLETSLAGVERAGELRDKMRQGVQDVCRVIILDPEKMVGSAQSGKAMEVLHGPMVELINELRPQIEERISNLIIKIGITLLTANHAGMNIPIDIPGGFMPMSWTISTLWPPIFAQTMDDLQKKVAVAAAAATAMIISRPTMTAWLAKDFGIEDVEEELARIAAEPVLNPFGF